MKRSLFAVLALVAVTATALPAMADGHKPNFPMPAAAFQQHVDAKVARAREHMEKRIVEHKMTPEQATAARTRFGEVVTRVSAEVQKAVADGTVTADEAKAVREVARGLGHGERHHAGS